MNIDAELDVIFQKVDSLFQQAKFDEVDDFLSKVNIRFMDETLISGHLAACNAGKQHLKKYAKFFEKCKAYMTITSGEQETAEILHGLEPRNNMRLF